jgi:hypothetical protein
MSIGSWQIAVRCDRTSKNGDDLTSSLSELLISTLQSHPIGRFGRSAWQVDLLAMDLLETDDEHRSIGFREDGRTDFDHVIRSNGEEETIERGVMQLAEGDAITHDWLAPEIAVRRDMRSVEKLLVPQSAKSAPLSISANHTLTESNLMQSAAERSRHIGSPRLRILLRRESLVNGAVGRLEVVDL